MLISWLYGTSGYIWKTGPLAQYLNKFILVNALIMGAVAYIGLGLLDTKDRFKSTQAQVGLGIIILVFSIMIAGRIGQH